MAAHLGNQVVVGIDVIPKIISMVCDLGRKYLPSLRLSFVMHNMGVITVFLHRCVVLTD